MTTRHTEQIEAYLNGSLTGEAREAFERAMQNDPRLAEDVQVHRDMAEALRPSPTEDALRANLEILGRRHHPARSARWWWIAGGVVVAGLIGWWIWRSAAPKAQPPQSPARPPVAQTIPGDSLPAPASEKYLPTKPTEQKQAPRLLAADYRPNPRLEAITGNQYRGQDYRFRISHPASGLRLNRQDGQVAFRLEGSVETDARAINPPFRVLLFTNKPEDYEQFRYVHAARLAFEESDGAFSFRLAEQLPLLPGLYYFLIEDEDSGMVFYVGKVSVY